jgi:integrase
MQKRESSGEGTYISNSSGTVTNKKWYIMPDGAKRSKSFTASSKAKARALRLSWEGTHNKNFSKVTATLYDYLIRWAPMYVENSVKQTTYNIVEDTIRCRIRPYMIANLQLGQMTSDVCAAYINQLVKHGYALSTIRKSYDLLKSCFAHAVTVGDLSKNPMDVVSMPSESRVKPTKEMQFFVEDDVKRLITVADKRFANGERARWYGYAIVLLAYTGLRRGELLGLKWKNVDLVNKKIRIKEQVVGVYESSEDGKRVLVKKTLTTKSKSSTRDVPLAQRAIWALENIREMYGRHTAPDDYVVLTKDFGRPDERNLRRAFSSMQKIAGTSLQDAGLHTLRHTFASIMIYKGCNIIVLSKILGHSKPSITMNIYAHIIEEQKVSAIDILDS